MTRSRTRLATFLLSLLLALATFNAVSEDIDIFSVDEENTVDKPNVLIVLDNSTAWSQQAQHWPESINQGQSEVRAIRNIINQLPDESVNVGLMLFSTEQPPPEARDGGTVRFHIKLMDSTNKAGLSAELDTIFNNTEGNNGEGRDQNRPWGDLFWDVYNYFTGGEQSHGGDGTLASRADPLAYASQFDRFRSPLTSIDSCRRNIVIFLANNGNSGIRGDSADNTSALTAAGGDPSQIPWSNYTLEETTGSDNLGYTTACYDSVDACTSAVNTPGSCTDEGYTSCSCSPTSPISCPGTQNSKFTVYGVNTTEVATTTSNTTTSATVSLGSTLSCKTSGQMNGVTATCPANPTPQTTQSGTTRTTVTTTYSNCAYVNTGTSGCTGSKANYEAQGTKSTQTLVQEVTATTTRTSLGESAACYVDASSCSTTGYDCTAYNSGCECSTPSSTAGCNTSSGNKYQVLANFTSTVATEAGGSRVPPTQAGKQFMVDEWTRFLRQVGVPLPGTDPAVRVPVTTYTIDVFKDNPDNSGNTSALLFNMANVGGGRYYQAKNEDQIEKALGEIFAEVQAVNTAFASASLPVSATNRAQNENQVFIGLFRPDRVAAPRWFGNMKRFQIIADNNELLLGDKNGRAAVNNLTGFLSECSASYWTTDSGNYWLTVTSDDPPAVGLCTTDGDSSGPNSDLPDGPFVEKGAVAEVLRRGNDPSAVPDADGNFVLNRNVLTRGNTPDTALIAFNATSAPSLDTDTLNYTLGKDWADEEAAPDGNITEPRSTIHGDVVHSRPQPINYGDDGIIVYYGANDGTFRAVKAADGTELWAFIAPEHFDKLQRLRQNTPNIKYFDPNGVFSGTQVKDYFFDGSTGLIQKADNSAVWIYPSMRRGGRKVYALDVTDPENPRYKWSKGCPNLDDDTNCDTGFTAIGQTWSLPNPGYIANYDSGNSPVLVFGGGYDSCEDINTGDLSTACASEKGRQIYIVDADDGTLIENFATERSVAADVALVDVDFDDKVDYAYAADTGGAVYRIDLTTAQPWQMTKIAYTTGDDRKFLFAPALLQAQTTGGAPVIYVALGSGDREHPLRGQYPYADPVTNRFYVFKDFPQAISADPFVALDLDGDDMLNKSTADVTDETCETKIIPGSTEQGWYIDLVDHGIGEQTVTSAAIAGGQVFFSTNRAEPLPEDSASCTTSLGAAEGYALDILSAKGTLGEGGACGVRSDEFAGGGLPPSPVIATVPVEGVGVVTVCIGCGGRDSPLDPGDINTVIPSIRKAIYWYTIGDTE